MITVQEMMSQNPITLSRYNTLNDARKLMSEKKIRHILVVEDNQKLVGLVSQRNVLANAVSSQDFINKEELAKIESGTLLVDIMSTGITTVKSDMRIADAAHLLHKKKFGCLPVIDEDNCLVGIITDHDFVSMTIQLLDMMDANEPLELDD